MFVVIISMVLKIVYDIDGLPYVKVVPGDGLRQ